MQGTLGQLGKGVALLWHSSEFGSVAESTIAVQGELGLLDSGLEESEDIVYGSSLQGHCFPCFFCYARPRKVPTKKWWFDLTGCQLHQYENGVKSCSIA